MLGLLLADVTAGTRAEVCILECPLVFFVFLVAIVDCMTYPATLQ